MSFEIKPATRQGVKPLISLYSKSGCGKTWSSLLLARGLSGPTGNIVLIDTESGRGHFYAKELPGGYNVIELSEPFSPARYIDAIRAAEAGGADVIIVDSVSHEWEGLGGVCDLADQNEAKSGKPGLHNWRGPKMEHAKFILKLLQSHCPIICCIRSKNKTRQSKDERGKTMIEKDAEASPIQSEDFIFESTVYAEIVNDHSLRRMKELPIGLWECFPQTGPIEIKHGEALAKWCASPGGPGTGKPAEKPSEPLDDRKSLLKELWELAKSVRGDKKDWIAFEAWAVKATVMGEGDPPITSMTLDQLRNVIEQTKKIMQ